MQLPVMAATERDSELVADFQPNGSGLGKAKVVRIAGLAPADRTRLGCHKFQVRLIP